MRQNDHNSPSPRTCVPLSTFNARMIQTVTCAAVLCLSFAAIMPAHGQTAAAPAKQDKKNKKKPMTPAPPKTKGAMDTPAHVVLVFPPETKGGVSDQVADVITEVVQTRLNLSDKYKTALFLSSNPVVKRALVEGSLTKTELEHPVATGALIKKLTDLTAHDMAVVVSIIDYQFDKATNRVSLVMSAKLLDYTGPAPRGTNRNGESPAKPSSKATEYDLAATLARDLTEKMMSDLLNAKPVMTEKK